jgi:hypothetical protein
MNDLHGTFNRCEAAFWFVISAVFAGRALILMTTRQSRPTLESVLSLAFAAFGMSDLIEVSTGAWWRPWWLLLLKGVCVLTFAACYAVHRRRQRSLRV